MKNRNRLGRLFAVATLGFSSMFSTGCFNTDDIWFGFNAGLGAIPANLVGNYITANFLGFLTPDDDAE
jgi:hypothetical protein